MSLAAVEPLSARYGASYRWLVTGTAIVGTMAMVLTATIINVAIPDIMGAFGVGQDRVQWLATGFLAAATSGMLMADWCMRTLGHRAAYIGAMAVFVGGSVLGGTTASFDLLIVSRVLLGVASGVTQPIAMVAIYQEFPPEERGTAMGIYGLGVILAPALGPYVGGIAIDATSWQFVFILPIPFCLFASLMALFFLSPREANHKPEPFDWIGLILLVVFVSALLIGFSNTPGDGWYADSVIRNFLISAAALIAFIAWEAGFPTPLLQIRMFRDPRFAVVGLVSFLYGAILFSSFYLVPLFVQIVQGYTATRSGLLQVPAGIIMGLAFPIFGRLSDRGGNNYLMMAGLVVVCASSFLMVGAHTDTPFWLFSGWLILSRVGLAMIFPSLMNVSIQLVAPEKMGQATGVQNFLRQLGAAFGVNLLAISTVARSAFHRQALTDTQTAANAATTEILDKIKDILSTAGLPETLQEPASLLYLGRTIIAQADASAFRDGFMIMAVVAAAVVIPAWFARPKKVAVERSEGG